MFVRAQAIDPNTPVLLCGDFNTVTYPYLDRFGCNPNSPWAYNWLSTHRDLMGTYELTDAWRAKHPDTKEFTWRRPNGQQGSRIDMIWIPSRFLGLVSSVGIFPFFRSDHSYVYLEIDLPFEIERGKGIWKFNTSHLKDESFCAEIERFWTNWRTEQCQFLALSAWWDAGKARLKKLIGQWSWETSYTRNQKIKTLNDSLSILHQQMVSGEAPPSRYEEVRAELEAALETKAKGAQIRARTQWAEEGEKSTKYFLRQEKIHGQRRLIAAIRRVDGSIAKETSDILAVWRDYYFKLFSAQPLDHHDQCQFVNSLERQLSPEEAETCEGPLSLPECHVALRAMALNKSPGIDGLPTEFYLTFWGTIGADLVNVFNSCFEVGKLSLTQRSGAITLLFKKGDILDTANWRPITLLCSDYKIAAKALSNRLLRVIASVISPDQSCGIPGRFMGENVRLLQDVCDYAHAEAIPAAILSLDQEKAFDRVEWKFLEKVLVKMGFGPSFRNWISLLYSSVNSAVIVNGHLTKSFPVSRGVRQGCPLSPLLYVLVAETMACRVRADSHIDGFPLPCSAKRVKISQYADDTTILVKSDFSIIALFELFAAYERASGARLNLRKCSGLLLGPWRTRLPELMPVQRRWSASSITVLGCQILPGGSQEWGPLVGKLTSIIDTWKARKLSFRGRALIINSLGLSKFWYRASVCYMPPNIINEINSQIFPFVWGKKREWLCRTSVTQSVGQGGLSVTNLSRKLSSLHIQWVKRFLLGEDHPWKYFFRHFLRRAMLAEPVERIFNQITIGSGTMRRLPAFYQGVVQAWIDVKGKRTVEEWVVPGSELTSDIPLNKLTSRAAYLRLSQLQNMPHRCINKHPSVEWPTVWTNLSCLLFVRPALDTSWLIAHGILPTADRLIRFKMAVHPACHCGQPESLEHLLYHCPLAQELISWLYDLMMRHLRRTPRPSVKEMLFGYSRVTNIPRGFVALLGIIRHQIWCARNKSRFEDVTPTVLDILERIKSSFRFISRIQRRHMGLTHFATRWLVGGVLGIVDGTGSITFAQELRSTHATQ